MPPLLLLMVIGYRLLKVNSLEVIVIVIVVVKDNNYC